jgi:hypothetical protein
MLKYIVLHYITLHENSSCSAVNWAKVVGLWGLSAEITAKGGNCQKVSFNF